MGNRTPQKLTRKQARLQVSQALFSLTDLEHTLGKKKFKRRMQKVEKILLAGIRKAKKEKEPRPAASVFEI